MDSQLGGVNNFIANYIKNNPQIEFVGVIIKSCGLAKIA